MHLVGVVQNFNKSSRQVHYIGALSPRCSGFGFRSTKKRYQRFNIKKLTKEWVSIHLEGLNVMGHFVIGIVPSGPHRPPAEVPPSSSLTESREFPSRVTSTYPRTAQCTCFHLTFNGGGPSMPPLTVRKVRSVASCSRARAHSPQESRALVDTI